MRRRLVAAAVTALAMLTSQATTAVLGASSSTYLGCYADRADAVARALPLVQELSPTMTVASCLTKCAELGFEYAGLEYKQECYCGAKPPPYEKLLDAQCATACGGGGDRTCGGALSLSVYKQTVSQPTFDAERPLLCLVMILKDEAHTILATLRAVADVIDCWTILDTGSTDGTQKTIQDFFAGHKSILLKGKAVPGQIFEEAFVDYGATRNRVLTLSKEHANPIFTLMLSADEEMLNPTDMRRFLQEMRFARGTQHGAYAVLMNTGLKFDSLRIARVDSLWRYRGRVHEYLAPPADQPYRALYRSPVPFDVKFSATDGPRRLASQYTIRRVLEEDLAKNPNDTRAIYYLARTNSGINNHSEAYRYYDMLSKVSKWDEEIYHGMVMRAIESKHLLLHWHERQTMLLDAFAYKPNNMDALHALAQDHFDSGRFQLAYLFAMRAVALPVPPGLAAIENVLLRPTKYLYDYEGHRLLGFAAREIAEWATCVASFHHVLKSRPEDTIVRDRVQLCETELAAMGKYVQPDVHPRADGLDVPSARVVITDSPNKLFDPRQRVAAAAAARGRAADAMTESDPDSQLHPYGDRYFAATSDTIHVDLSLRTALITLFFFVAAIAALVFRKLMRGEQKIKL